MLKLYYSPGSCSLASHIALEETGLPYAAIKVDLQKGEQESEEYRTITAWSRVPALGVGDMVLTENVAILQYLADRVPEKALLPQPGTFERARAVEWLALLSSTVHAAFRPIFRPNRFATSEAGIQEVAAIGLNGLNRTLGLLERRLGDDPYTLGQAFSLCDAYLLVFLLWTERPVFRGKLDSLPRLHACARRITQRPAVRAAMTAEGLDLDIA